MPTCPRCGKTVFGPMRDEILRRSLPWLSKFETLQCNSCGARVIICPKCGNILTEISMVDRSRVVGKCKYCGYEAKEIIDWLKEVGS